MNILFLILLFLIPANAHAYIDPGSGSMLLQLILGGIVGAGMFLKVFWNKIISIFKPAKNTDQADLKKN